MGWAKKPSFTFPGFGSGIDIYKAIGKLPKPKQDGHQVIKNIWARINPLISS